MGIETNSSIYNWNRHPLTSSQVRQEFLKTVKTHEETFRDGAQAAGLGHCKREQKILMLRLMNEIGIHRANIGFPISSKVQFDDICEIAKVKKEEGWNIELMCAARTLPADVEAIAEVSQKTGVEIWAGIFLAGSALRAQIMGWDLLDMAKKIPAPITIARKHNLPVMFVTEDTTRSHPEIIKLYNQIAIENGARQLCLCDTVGFATPEGTTALVRFFLDEIVKNQTVDGKPVETEWHGHDHRGFAWANTWAATRAGVNWVEGTLLGIGEMMGNCPTEDILVNLFLEGQTKFKTELLNQLLHLYAHSVKVKISDYWRVAGKYAYATGSGVHADAILKGYEMDEPDLAAIVYCGYPPRIVGRDVDAFIGQMSGDASVKLALLKRGVTNPAFTLVKKILETAKRRRTSLTEKEVASLAGIPYQPQEKYLW